MKRWQAGKVKSRIHATFKGDVLDRDRYIEGNTNGTRIWRAQTLHEIDVVVVEDVAILTAVGTDEVKVPVITPSTASI